MTPETAFSYLADLDAWKVEADEWYAKQRQWAASGGYDDGSESPAGVYPPVPKNP